jgi:zinc D-Ala-D-Ala carboxypeptidase
MANKIDKSIIIIPIGLIMYALYKALPHSNTDKPDQISANFTMSEFAVTNTGLPNTIPAPQQAWIVALVQEILQPLRDKIGSIIITSGYRSTEVNTRIGGSPYSQHMEGQASDITSPTLTPKEIFLTLYNSPYPIKQCILYAPNDGNFVHVSIDPKRPAKRQFMIMESGTFTPYNGGEIIL